MPRSLSASTQRKERDIVRNLETFVPFTSWNAELRQTRFINAVFKRWAKDPARKDDVKTLAYARGVGENLGESVQWERSNRRRITNAIKHPHTAKSKATREEAKHFTSQHGKHVYEQMHRANEEQQRTRRQRALSEQQRLQRFVSHARGTQVSREGGWFNTFSVSNLDIFINKQNTHTEGEVGTEHNKHYIHRTMQQARSGFVEDRLKEKLTVQVARAYKEALDKVGGRTGYRSISFQCELRVNAGGMQYSILIGDFKKAATNFRLNSSSDSANETLVNTMIGETLEQLEDYLANYEAFANGIEEIESFDVYWHPNVTSAFRHFPCDPRLSTCTTSRYNMVWSIVNDDVHCLTHTLNLWRLQHATACKDREVQVLKDLRLSHQVTVAQLHTAMKRSKVVRGAWEGRHLSDDEYEHIVSTNEAMQALVVLKADQWVTEDGDCGCGEATSEATFDMNKACMPSVEYVSKGYTKCVERAGNGALKGVCTLLRLTEYREGADPQCHWTLVANASKFWHEHRGKRIRDQQSHNYAHVCIYCQKVFATTKTRNEHILQHCACTEGESYRQTIKFPEDAHANRFSNYERLEKRPFWFAYDIESYFESCERHNRPAQKHVVGSVSFTLFVRREYEEWMNQFETRREWYFSVKDYDEPHLESLTVLKEVATRLLSKLNDRSTHYPISGHSSRRYQRMRYGDTGSTACMLCHESFEAYVDGTPTLEDGLSYCSRDSGDRHKLVWNAEHTTFMHNDVPCDAPAKIMLHWTHPKYIVRDHEHLVKRDNFRGLAHNSCNRRAGRWAQEVRVFAHNGRHYDFAMGLQPTLAKIVHPRFIKPMSKNTNTLLAVCVEVSIGDEDEYGRYLWGLWTDEYANISPQTGRIAFHDSLALYGAGCGLGSLVQELYKEKGYTSFRATCAYLKKLHRSLPGARRPPLREYYKRMCSNKMVMPFALGTSREALLQQREFPPRESFHSDLGKGSDISDVDYDNARWFWETHSRTSVESMYEIYNVLDCHMLNDCLRNWQDVCATMSGGLCILKHISIAEFAGNFVKKSLMSIAATQHVDVRTYTPQLCTEAQREMYLDAERNIRGGLSTLTTNFVQEMEEDNNIIIKIDVNSMYPAAMCYRLPWGKYRRMAKSSHASVMKRVSDSANKERTDVERYEASLEFGESWERGYHITVDIVPSCEDISLRRELPPIFANTGRTASAHEPAIEMSDLSEYQQEMMRAHKLKLPHRQLVATLRKKKRITLHHKLLHFALMQGAQVTKVYNIVTFEQRAYLKPIIEKLYAKRLDAKRGGQRLLAAAYKLCMNAIYGKHVQNDRMRWSACLVHDEERACRAHSGNDTRIISADGMWYIHRLQNSVLLKSNVIQGHAILDIAKVLYLSQAYLVKESIDGNHGASHDCSFLGGDTDSMALNINNIDGNMQHLARIAPYFLDTTGLDVEGHPLRALAHICPENRGRVGYSKYDFDGRCSALLQLAPKLYLVRCVALEDNFVDGKCVWRKGDVIITSKGKGVGAYSRLTWEQGMYMYRSTSVFDKVATSDFRDIRRSKDGVFTDMLNKVCARFHCVKRRWLSADVSVPYS